jgi:hypothetical protein
MKTLTDYTKTLMLGLLLLAWTTSLFSEASAADIQGVDLERLASDLSQEEEIVRAITQSLVSQGMVQPPHKSERSDNVWRPAYYQRMRTSASTWDSVTVAVFAGRTIREVRVNMQGTRNRLPPAASFSHDWDSVLVTEDSMEMRAGALGISLDGTMEPQVRKEFCAAVYRAAMEHPIARVRVEAASPMLSAGLMEHVRNNNGYLDFRTNAEATTKAVASKVLAVSGYWNQRSRPWFYVGVFLLLAVLLWCCVKMWRRAKRWWKQRKEKMPGIINALPDVKHCQSKRNGGGGTGG